MPQRRSKRFDPTVWSEWVAPLLMAALLVFLLATLAVIALSILGLTPR